MKAFIDKDNIRNILKIEDIYSLQNIENIFRTQLNTVCNFSKNDLFKNDELSAFAGIFTEGVKRENPISFLKTFIPKRPINPRFFDELTNDGLCSLFLISDHENIESCIKKGAVAIARPGDEHKLFNSLTFNHENYDLKLRIGSDKFSKWEDLENFSLPFTELILVDRYIFSDSDLASVNYTGIIKALHKNKQVRTNIIIYTSENDCSLTFDEIKKLTNKVIDKNVPKPKITLIKAKQSVIEHDRTIWTNYFRIYSGDSFNYFDSKGEKITRGKEIQFSSHLNLNNESVGLELIKDLQNNVNRLIELGQASQIEGDKISKFLNF